MEFVPGSVRLAAVPFGLAVLVAIPAPYLALVFVAVAAGVLAFNRDPPRPIGSGVVSPAEGTVSVIRTERDDAGRERLRVGVYMSALDVHVNRAPLSGDVTSIEREPGANRPAFSKDSDRNERVRIRVDRDGEDYEVVLIAGWFARRIHPHVETGDSVERGERIGHISFGSRADVICPPDVDGTNLVVAEGEQVRAGQTLAER